MNGDQQNIREHVATTLDRLRRDLAENGNRIVYFSPYIPLIVIYPDDQPVPHGWVRYCGGIAKAESVAYTELVNTSGERNVWLSQMVHDIAGLDHILDECQQ